MIAFSLYLLARVHLLRSVFIMENATQCKKAVSDFETALDYNNLFYIVGSSDTPNSFTAFYE